MTPSSGRPRRLVFGDDGSSNADVAWLWINNHPWPGWRIEGWTGSLEPISAASDWGSTPSAEAWTPPWSRAYLGDATDVEVATFRIDSDPRLVLGEQVDVDLLVVGVGGHDVGSMWSGSTAEWLVRHPPAPLVIARSAAVVRRVVWCVDGSRHSAAAMEAFLSLPLAAEVHVTVLVVDDGRTDDADVVDDAQRVLSEHGTASDVVRLSGKATRAILGHLEAQGPDLVVLGTRGLTGLRRLRVGSTAGAIVRSARCTTLLACVDEADGGA